MGPYLSSLSLQKRWVGSHRITDGTEWWHLWDGDKTKVNIQNYAKRPDSKGSWVVGTDKRGAHQGVVCHWTLCQCLGMNGEHLLSYNQRPDGILFLLSSVLNVIFPFPFYDAFC